MQININNRVFHIVGKGLVLSKNNEFVSQDEPVFILRARDKKALGTIRCYQALFAPSSEHWKTIQAVIDDFTKFREENPARMGHPEEVY